MLLIPALRLWLVYSFTNPLANIQINLIYRKEMKIKFNYNIFRITVFSLWVS